MVRVSCFVNLLLYLMIFDDTFNDKMGASKTHQGAIRLLSE